MDAVLSWRGPSTPKLIACSLLAWWCAACSSPDRPSPIDVGYVSRPDVPDRVPDKSSVYEPEECFVPAPEGYAVDCGRVSVREGPDSDRTIQLAVMILYTASKTPGEPVVYLEGGPGGSALSLAEYEPFFFDHILENHDLVLVDQRGTGYSNPSIYCPEDITATPAEALLAVEACRVAWQDRGVDLAQYNTRQNARDVELVRQALGYDRWHVYGISYGSRLALTMARDFPDHISSIVVDGVLPLQVDLLAGNTPALADSLEAVNAGCLAQPDCAEAYGDIIVKLFATVDRLNSNPAVLELGENSLELSGSLLFSLFSQLLYAGEVIPYFPVLIDQVHSEQYDVVEVLFVDEGGPRFANGMYYSVVCQDEAPFTSADAIAAARAELDPHYQLGFDATQLLLACDAWDVPASPVAENETVVSDIPALVTSGAFDPVTPPAFGSMAAEGLQNAQEFVLVTESHGASLSSCGMQLVKSFLADPYGVVLGSCVNALRGPDYLVAKRWAATEAGVRFKVAPELDAALQDRLRDALERSTRHRWLGSNGNP